MIFPEKNERKCLKMNRNRMEAISNNRVDCGARVCSSVFAALLMGAFVSVCVLLMSDGVTAAVSEQIDNQI